MKDTFLAGIASGFFTFSTFLLRAFCTVRESLFPYQVGEQIPMHGSKARATGLCGYEGSSLPKVFILRTLNFSFFVQLPQLL